MPGRSTRGNCYRWKEPRLDSSAPARGWDDQDGIFQPLAEYWSLEVGGGVLGTSVLMFRDLDDKLQPRESKPEVVEVSSLSFAEHTATIMGSFGMSIAQLATTWDLVIPQQRFFVVPVGGKVAAGYRLVVGDTSASINNLWVAQQYRGMGLARALMESAGDMGSPLSLVVDDDNAAARHIYRDLGFRDIARQHYVWFGDAEPPEWLAWAKSSC